MPPFTIELPFASFSAICFASSDLILANFSRSAFGAVLAALMLQLAKLPSAATVANGSATSIVSSKRFIKYLHDFQAIRLEMEAMAKLQRIRRRYPTPHGSFRYSA